MKHIYLIRHGQSKINATGVSKNTDYKEHLSTLGKTQARITGKYLASFHSNPAFDIIFSSPFRRAIDTAKIIAKNMSFDINNIKINNDLREIDQSGDLYGIKISEKGSNGYDYYEAYAKVLKTHDPLGESSMTIYPEKYGLDEFTTKYHLEPIMIGYERIRSFIKKILDSDHNKVLIVAHGGIIMTLIMGLLNAECFIGNTKGATSNCSITHFTYDKLAPNKKVMFHSIKATEHLSDSNPIINYVPICRLKSISSSHLTKQVYFISCCETDDNRLTVLGETQAKTIGRYLTDYQLTLPFDVIYSSSHRSIYDTAKIITKTIGLNTKNIIIKENRIVDATNSACELSSEYLRDILNLDNNKIMIISDDDHINMFLANLLNTTYTDISSGNTKSKDGTITCFTFDKTKSKRFKFSFIKDTSYFKFYNKQ